MVSYKGRLDQVLFTVFFKEQVYDITLGMTILKFNVVFSGKCLGLFVCCYRIKVNTCIFLNAVCHGDTFKRLAEIQLNTIIFKLCCPKDCLSQITEHGLGKLHHSFVICICLIQFH